MNMHMLKNMLETGVAGRLLGSRRGRSYRRPGDYFRTNDIGLYIGWLGHGNFGDELLYESYKRLFPGLQLVDCIRPHSLEISANKLLFRQNVKAAFLGGGTLINNPYYLRYCERALDSGLDLIIFGTGVSAPNSITEFGKTPVPEEIQRRWVDVLDASKFVGVRGYHSQSLLTEQGFESSVVVGDTALALCGESHKTSETIGINVGMLGHSELGLEQYCAVIEEVIADLLGKGRRVELVPLHRVDYGISTKLAGKFPGRPISIWKDYLDLEKTVSRIAGFRLMISQRLHGAVVATGCGVPAVSLAYRAKCDDYMNSIGMDEYLVKPDELSGTAIMERVNRIDANYAAIRSALLQRTAEYRNRQRDFSNALNGSLT